MITCDNLRFHEIIGLGVEVVNSTNPQIIGISGKIINETKSMFVLNTKKGIKKLPKENSMWKFLLDDTTIVLSGKLLKKRPYERLGVRE